MDGNSYCVYVISDIYSIIDEDPPILIYRSRKFIFVFKIAPFAEVEERGKLRKMVIKMEKSIAESSVRRCIIYFY